MLGTRVPAGEPAIRESESLLRDVARSIELLSNPMSLRDPLWIPPHRYPASAADAARWLRRLRPLIVRTLGDRLLNGDLNTARTLVAVLADTPGGVRQITALLRRSYRSAESGSIIARATALRGLGEQLPAPEAECVTLHALRDIERLHTNGWLQRIGSGTCRRWHPSYSFNMVDGPVPDEGEAPPLAQEQCERALDVLEAARAARMTVEMSSGRADLLDAFSAAVVGLSSAPAQSPRCRRDPTDDEQALAAVLRFLFELDPEPLAQIEVPDPTCLSVRTLGGPVPLVAPDGEEVGVLHLDAPEPVITEEENRRDGGRNMLVREDFDRGDPEWDEAPTRWVHVWWQGGHLAGSGDAVIVKRIRGRWIVVATRHLWVS